MPPKCGKLTIRFRSNEYIETSHPVLLFSVNANRELSGEIRGEREIVPR